jgi:O-6-methylguanine DNA methyltransferase
MLDYWIFATSLGEACLVAGEKGIRRLILPGWDREKILEHVSDLYPKARPGNNPSANVQAAMEFVKKCFYGADLKIPCALDLSELREFQKQVLEIVSRIPRGQTRSYAWVAEQLKNPKAVRAVAQALARNPLPLFIPCHRVLGKDGSLKGFSAPQGLHMKKFLLDLEQRSAKKPAG